MNARYLPVMFGLIAMAMVAVAEEEPTTSLKTIMQQLRNDTVLILNATLVDDMASVAEAALRISEHPRIPPAQVALVAAELGPEMAAFKQFDTLVYDLSVSMREAALDGDRIREQKHFQDMLSGCLACHASYRKRVTSVLTVAQEPN